MASSQSHPPARRAGRAAIAVSALLVAVALGWAGCKGVPFTARGGTTIRLSANPTEIAASDAFSTITASLIEESGIPVVNGTVVTFTSNLGAVSPEAKTRDGVAVATLSANGVAGSATVTALSGAATAATVNVTIGIAASSIALTATPSSLPSGGGSVELSATVFGASGSPVRGAAVVFSTTEGSLASAGQAVTTDASGRAIDRLSIVRTAEVTVTSGSRTAKVTIAVGATGISTLILSADRVSLPSGGGTANLVAVVLGDSGPIPGVPVAWTADAGQLGAPGTTISDAAGQATNTLNTALTTTVTVGAAGVTDSLQITVGAGTSDVRVVISARRGSIPRQALVSDLGSCAAPGPILPIEVFASVTDANGNPVASRDVTFFMDFEGLSDCALNFGQFCGGANSVVATTNSQGVATVLFELTQEDLDSCNCNPSGCNCLPSTQVCDSSTTPPTMGSGFCPDPATCRTSATCRQTPAPEDLFCQAPLAAVSGGVASDNLQYIEYN